MPDAAQKRGVPVRDFNEASSGETFAKGEAQDFDAGMHANYLAAGLITEPKTSGPAKAAS